MNKEEKELQFIIKKTIIEQRRLLKFFAKMNLIQQKEIINNQRTIFHKLKNITQKNIDNSTLTLASLIISIDTFILAQNNTELNFIKFNNKNIKKYKTEKLLTYWSIVKELKVKKNMSFREISNFLKKYHKLEISYSLIYKVWSEIEKNHFTIDN